MRLTYTHGLIGAGLLVALHGVLAILPSPPFSPAMNLVLLATNLYVLYCAGRVLQRRRPILAAVFIAGYAALYLLALVAMGKQSLFILLAVVYAAVFGSPPLLGLFVVAVLCFVVFQPYGFETFIPLGLIYVILWRARRSASRFALLCLAAGLLGLFAVLFPIIHLVLQDSAQTLWYTLTRSDVLEALGVSLASASVATLVCGAFGVPLAYALARVDFAGKRWVESFVDLPILVPQSVAGIALIVLLGPGSPLGHGLDALGLGVSGTFIGIVVAQVFVASPFLIKTAMTAFEAVPRELEQASRSLGHTAASTFARISLPLAARGILVGAALAWARAISELGCLILFASSPVSAPVLVHTEFLRAGVSESRPIAVLLLIVCLWVFLILQLGQTLMPFAFRRRGDGTLAFQRRGGGA